MELLWMYWKNLKIIWDLELKSFEIHIMTFVVKFKKSCT